MKKKLKTLCLSKETIVTLDRAAAGTLDPLNTLTTLTATLQPGSLLEGCPPITTVDTTLSGGC